MEWLQEKATLLGVAWSNHSRDQSVCALGFLVAPLVIALRLRRKTVKATRMAAATTDLAFTPSLKNGLDTRAEELEVDLGFRLRDILVRQALDPLKDGAVLGIVTRRPVRPPRVRESTRFRVERFQQQAAVLWVIRVDQLADHVEVTPRLLAGPPAVSFRPLKTEPHVRLPGVTHHARRVRPFAAARGSATIRHEDALNCVPIRLHIV